MTDDQLIEQYLLTNSVTIINPAPPPLTAKQVECSLTAHTNLTAMRAGMIECFEHKSNQGYRPNPRAGWSASMDMTTVDYGN